MLASKDLGASLFTTWPEEKKREEVAKLVEGYRAGLPVGILCKMAETVAGSREAAREILLSLLTEDERRAAIAAEQGGMRLVVESYLQ